MKKNTTKIIGVFAVILVIAAAVLAAFFVMRNKKTSEKSDELSILLEKDLENAYPETPTEVVKLYWRLNKYLYNKEYSEEDLEKLMEQLRLLYDDELLEVEGNDLATMMQNFKKDKEAHKGETIVSTVVEKYDSVKVEKGEDKKNYATVIVAKHTKTNGKASVNYESFRCRREKQGKWKILGWKAATKQEAIDAEVQ